MLKAQTKASDINVSRTLDVLKLAFDDYGPRNFAFRLWDDTIWPQTEGQPRLFTISLNHAAALRRMFLPLTERRLAEAYIYGDFDIDGNIMCALPVARQIGETWRWIRSLRLLSQLLRLPSQVPSSGARQAALTGYRHSRSRDKQAIQHHYDVSNDFYKLWLDDEMVYSCAYFINANNDINSAQKQKLDYICRKLRLQSGERILDIGCGWGALLIHAAKHYGVQATGITLSQKQYDLARKRIEQAGLQDRCHVMLVDYREVDENQPFDKIVSIGMVEHVGREKLSTYFEKAYRLLKPGGVFLNHGITIRKEHFFPLNSGKDSFFQQYIFPDGDLQPISYILSTAEGALFEVRDVENLREHYAKTLTRWAQRFEAKQNEITKLVGDAGYRQWRLYLIAARWLFENGSHEIHQSLLYKQDDTSTQHDLPLTRSDWYQ
ncbi:class I SAM-dependent methyltransferase [Candidatus Saccharibacteria bacterium]|nr:class I SAM-dependent methyltransferase [Candidatus Saccharibacteria bacterium]